MKRNPLTLVLVLISGHPLKLGIQKNMIQTFNASDLSTDFKAVSPDLLHSPELNFLDYFNFKESQEASLAQANSDDNGADGSTPICCGEAFFTVRDFMNHFEAEHKTQDLSNTEALEQLRSSSLTPSLTNMSLKKDDSYCHTPSLATISEADEPIIVAAPSAKRSRVISVSQGNKKAKELTEELSLIFDEWNAPTIDPSNMGYIDDSINQYAAYWNVGGAVETTNDYFVDYYGSNIQTDPISRSFTAPPSVGAESYQERRMSTYSMDESTKRFECPRPFCSKVYKNTNGLKYHLEHGNCEMEDEDLSEKLQNEEYIPDEIRVANRPYFCKIDGCGKKYKNLNGLKYHAKTAHPRIDFKSQVKGYTNSPAKISGQDF
jgi:hypothetical protein